MVIPAAASGKVKTTVQIIAIALLIIYSQLGEFRHLAPISLWIAMLLTAYSGIDYAVRFGRILLRSPDVSGPSAGGPQGPGGSA